MALSPTNGYFTNRFSTPSWTWWYNAHPTRRSEDHFDQVFHFLKFAIELRSIELRSIELRSIELRTHQEVDPNSWWHLLLGMAHWPQDSASHPGSTVETLLCLPCSEDQLPSFSRTQNLLYSFINTGSWSQLLMASFASSGSLTIRFSKSSWIHGCVIIMSDIFRRPDIIVFVI